MMRSRYRQLNGGRMAMPGAAALAMVLLTLGAAPRARAQDDPRPSLAGHTFVSTDLVPDAFVRTYVRTSLGYAEAQSIDYPPLVIQGDTLQVLNGSLSYAILGIEYQAALRNWIAMRIAGALVSRLGTQGSSLAREGVTITQGYDFGFLAKLRGHIQLQGAQGGSGNRNGAVRLRRAVIGGRPVAVGALPVGNPPGINRCHQIGLEAGGMCGH